jgi:hypothetical protein
VTHLRNVHLAHSIVFQLLVFLAPRVFHVSGRGIKVVRSVGVP